MGIGTKSETDFRRSSGKICLISAGAIVTLVAIVAGIHLRQRPPAELAPKGFPIQFRDVTEQTGIDFVHTDGSSGRRYIVESMSAGLATFDYDGDGLVDIYFPNGAPLPGAEYDRVPRHALYKNLGNWRFREATDEAGLGARSFGLGIAIGDYDNDGWPDIYLNNFGPNILYRNNGNGTFRDVTGPAGVARGRLVGAGACFLDIDGRGLLDLFVGNYIDLDLSRHVPKTVGGVPSYPSPKDYQPVPNTLFRNVGDGTFRDISLGSGIGGYAGRAMGMICADADNDGATDIFVLNDVLENFFFHNDGRGNFEEAALLMGVAVNARGEVLANMAVDCGDYDRDGRLDFFTTNYQSESPMLLRNLGHGLFEDVATATNAGESAFPYVNWGCGMVDFDNSGRRSIFLGNGHTEDNIELREPTTSYRCRNLVLQNTDTGKFLDVSDRAGLTSLPPHAARGVAFDDLDNDGAVDVVILNSRERPTVLRNRYYAHGGTNHWLQLRLAGVKANRDGVGARVRVVAGELSQIDEVHSGRGYQSHWGSRLSFGLGRHARADRIEVRWIGGGVDVLTDVPANQQLTIVEGRSAVGAPAPWRP